MLMVEMPDEKVGDTSSYGVSDGEGIVEEISVQGLSRGNQDGIGFETGCPPPSQATPVPVQAIQKVCQHEPVERLPWVIAGQVSEVQFGSLAFKLTNLIGDFGMSEHGYKHFMAFLKGPTGQSMPEVFTASPKCGVRGDEMDPLLPGLVNVHGSER